MMNRRTLLAAAPLLAAPALVAAQPAWPTRPVRITIPFTAGGASDIMVRPVAQRLEQMFNQPFTVDNRAGGGGAVGVGFAANQPADGYSLLVTTPGPLVLLPQMQSGGAFAYDSARSFTYISLMAGAPILCAVKADSPITNLAEYAAAARRAPEAMNFGSSGIGSMGHLTGTLFGMQADARMVHVPFRGAPEAQAAVLGNTTISLWDTAAGNVAAVRGGTLRGLAVSSATRAATLPDVPTAAEAGFPNVVSLNWFMLCGPAGLSPAIAERLHAAINTILDEADIVNRMNAAAFVRAEGVAQPQLAGWVAAEQARWTPVIRAAG
ncbi:Bug family tripartite tricarboxylate transporter substrate binding protein [Roseococcus microcysteis]|uniref:Bug family tripartite tricarboxylate transporter substrate binding protein n=1 Tax=Roseococcus microcysteis TaxID=2771361 RepID=UPI00168B3220|nr:tripartite tricarboxylate transporter substrate binding protein [Roseococcus microcysteis]